MISLNEILTAAQSLPPHERAQLVAALWEAATPEDWIPPGSEWAAEVRRRGEAYDQGAMTGDSWEAVRQRARKQAGLDD